MRHSLHRPSRPSRRVFRRKSARARHLEGFPYLFVYQEARPRRCCHSLLPSCPLSIYSSLRYSFYLFFSFTFLPVRNISFSPQTPEYVDVVDSVYARLRRLGFFVLQTSEPSVSSLTIAAEPRLDLTLVPLPRPLWNDISPRTSLSESATHSHTFSPSFRSTSRVPAALTSLSLPLSLFPFAHPRRNVLHLLRSPSLRSLRVRSFLVVLSSFPLLSPLLFCDYTLSFSLSADIFLISFTVRS